MPFVTSCHPLPLLPTVSQKLFDAYAEGAKRMVKFQTSEMGIIILKQLSDGEYIK